MVRASGRQIGVEIAMDRSGATVVGRLMQPNM
jgi:hypothetical protein